MGKNTGFMEFPREHATRRPVFERVNDWFEIYQDFAEEKLRAQGARCMDCGVPFCHTGCPVNNIIPDWNDLVYHGRWKEAVRTLHATNNFPELPDASVLHLAKHPVCWESTSRQSRSSRLRKTLLTGPSKKAGFIPSRRPSVPEKK